MIMPFSFYHNVYFTANNTYKLYIKYKPLVEKKLNLRYWKM